MKVVVKGLGPIRDVVKEPLELRLSNDATATVEDVLRMTAEILGKEFAARVYDPLSGKLNASALVLVNGRNIRYMTGLKTRVKDGDRIAIGALVSGG